MSTTNADTKLTYPQYYEQIGQHIRDRIHRGVYAPGAKIPSERQLSREFGVTQNTVSKALSILTRERILERKVGSGTYVRERAATQKSFVGAIYLDAYEPTHAYHGRYPMAVAATDGIARRLSGTGLRMHPFVIQSSGVEESKHPILYDQLHQSTLAGLITLAPIHIDFAQNVLDLGIPLVTVAMRLPSLGDRVPAIMMNSFEIGERLVRMCLEDGRRRIAIVCGPQLAEHGYHTGSADFVAGYRHALKEAGMAEQEWVFPTPYTKQGAKDAAQRLLDMNPQPDAALIIEPGMATNVRNHLHEAGVRVGTDMRMFSLNCTPDGDDREGPKGPPGSIVGERAVETLMELMKGRSAPALRKIETTTFELQAPQAVDAQTI